MKLKSGLMLREIAGQWVVVPLGERTVEFNAIMSLSESGAMLWKKIEQGAGIQDMVAAMQAEYLCDEAAVLSDVESFITDLTTKGLLES